MYLLVGWVINSAALYVTVLMIAGIRIETLATLLVAALVIGLLNTLIKPIVHAIALPITLLTFGIFALVINAALLVLASILVPGFVIDNFLSAFLGALILSVVSAILNSLIKKPSV